MAGGKRKTSGNVWWMGDGRRALVGPPKRAGPCVAAGQWVALRALCPCRWRRRWRASPRRPVWHPAGRSRATRGGRPTRAPPQSRSTAARAGMEVVVAAGRAGGGERACGMATRSVDASARRLHAEKERGTRMRRACGVRHAARGVRRAARGTRRAACGVRRAARGTRLRRRQLVESDDSQLIARARHQAREERRRLARALGEQQLLELGEGARAYGVGQRREVGDRVAWVGGHADTRVRRTRCEGMGVFP